MADAYRRFGLQHGELALAPLRELSANRVGDRIFDCLQDLKGSLRVGDGALALAELLQRQAHIEQVVAFRPGVAGGMVDDRSLLIALDSAARLPSEPTAYCETVESPTLST